MMEQNSGGMTYKSAGVDYSMLDPFKRAAQAAARATSGNLAGTGIQVVEASRGDSAFLLEFPDMYLAHVEEGLGTKNLVADAMFELTGKPWDDRVAQCNAAMAFNDIIVCGASIVSYALHLAENGSSLLKNEERTRAIIQGTSVACNMAGAAWAGGETPTLRGIIVEGTYLLSGSAVGIVKPKDRLIKGDIRHGDAIVVLHSSGIHANGLSLARKIAERLPQGYLTTLNDQRSYGAALLDPTVIYAELIYRLLNAGVQIHYVTNITGHAWAKLMRHPEPFTYVVGTMPPVPPIFPFMQEHGGIDDREMYKTFNMGGGLALIVDSSTENYERLARTLGYDLKSPSGANWTLCGRVESARERSVVLVERKIEYRAEELQVR